MIELTAQHPSWEDLLAYGQGRLEPSSAQTVENHLADCRRCCELLETAPADSFLDRLRDAGTNDTGTGDRLIPRELIDHARYRVLGLVGEGGMGTVYRAVHRRMERVVALKVMRPSLMRHPSAVQRFHQEARAAAQLHHPHIVTAHDADQAGDLHFLVMEYVEGRNLADHLRENGPLPVAEACRYVRQVALGLQHAHEQGMVHRDIKPHNLMLQTTSDPSGSSIKILDFGLARLPRAAEAPPSADPASGSLTGTGVVMGTADYIAPEQANDPRSADIRADIYALGCTLFHLLYGRPPFPEGTVAEKLARHAETPLPLLTRQRPDVPPELAAVLKRMTAKNPARRYATPAETAEALAPFCRANDRLPQPRHRWRRWLVAAVMLSAVGLLTGWFAFHGDEDNPPHRDDNSQPVVETPKPNVPVPVNRNILPGPEIPPGPDVPADLDGNPAEQAAIAVIQKHGGGVTLDSKQPNNPVIGVSVWMPSFTDDDLKSLASLTRVRKMSLANTKISGVGFKDLPGLKELTELEVSQTPFDDEGLKAIAAFSQLKILSLRSTKVTDSGLRELAPLKQLEELAVSNSFDRGDTGATNIAASMKQLRRLYIDNSGVGDVGVIELAKLPKLQLLTLNGTRVKDRGLEALTGLQTLEELQLSFSDVTDNSAAILARCKNLRVLNLFNTAITDRGLRELGTLPELRKLDLRGSHKISLEALTEFIKAHPDCSVKR